jgi:ribosomal protein L23
MAEEKKVSKAVAEAAKKEVAQKKATAPKAEEKKEAKKETLKKEEKKVVKEVKKEEKKPAATREEIMEASEIFLHPLISEKAIGVIEKENKITFIVQKQANKDEIKKAFETLYNAKAEKVNIIKDMKGRKKAIVKVNKEYKAENIATKLGII